MAVLDYLKSKNLTLFEFLYICLMAGYFITPNHLNLPIVPFVGLSVAYCIYIAVRDKSMFVRKEIVVYLFLMLTISLLYFLLTDTQTISSSENLGLKRVFSKYQQFLWMFFPLLLSYVFVTRSSHRQKITMLFLLVILITLVIIQTLGAIAINPDAARSFHTGEVTANEDLNPMVGNYYFVYLIPFLIGVLFSVFKNNRAIGLRIILMVLIVVLFDFQLKAQFTLALIITFAGIILMFGNTLKGAGGKMLFALVLLLLFTLIPLVLSFAIEHINSEQIVERLKEVYSFMVYGGEKGHNLGGRMELYRSAIDAFLKSPIYGNRYLPFDGHATLLTIPADLGLLGAIPFYYILFHARRLACIFVHNKYDMNVAFLMLVMMGLTNPIHSSSQISFGIWFITPFILNLSYEK